MVILLYYSVMSVRGIQCDCGKKHCLFEGEDGILWFYCGVDKVFFDEEESDT